MSTYSFGDRYIKELAERVNRLENSGATPPEMHYAPVHHDPSSVGGVYAPPLDFTGKRSHGIMVGPQIFEQGHQELQDFAAGHRGATTDVAIQGHQGPRVLRSPSLIPYQTRDTSNNVASDPSVDRLVGMLADLILSLTLSQLLQAHPTLFPCACTSGSSGAPRTRESTSFCPYSSPVCTRSSSRLLYLCSQAGGFVSASDIRACCLKSRGTPCPNVRCKSCVSTSLVFHGHRYRE